MHIQNQWSISLSIALTTVYIWVENFEMFLISRFLWVADDTKIITRERWNYYPWKFLNKTNLELHEHFHPYGNCNAHSLCFRFDSPFSRPPTSVTMLVKWAWSSKAQWLCHSWWMLWNAICCPRGGRSLTVSRHAPEHHPIRLRWV